MGKMFIHMEFSVFSFSSRGKEDCTMAAGAVSVRNGEAPFEQETGSSNQVSHSKTFERKI